MKASVMTKFDRKIFEASASIAREDLCVQLGTELSGKVQGAAQFHNAVAAEVARLRDCGHDLWSYDEDDDFEVWGPSYAPPSGPGIVITFRAGGPTEVKWSTQGQEQGCTRPAE